MAEIHQIFGVYINRLAENYILRRTLTISMATIAASNPLLPAFVPLRSIACSMVSVVNTPKIQGIPVSTAIEFILAAALAT